MGQDVQHLFIDITSILIKNDPYYVMKIEHIKVTSDMSKDSKSFDDDTCIIQYRLQCSVNATG